MSTDQLGIGERRGVGALGETRPIECSVLRGGTSKGLFFRDSALPRDRSVIEQILLNVFGSPDPRQINGLGGATSQTSKAAVIGPASRPDADVDYTFAQVSVNEPVVDWGGNCGNLSAAVGPYAVDHGLVPVDGESATVRIHNTNTNSIIISRFATRAGRAVVAGEYAIPGVPGAGAPIMLEFCEPAGSVTGALLPTGQPRDELTLGDGRRLTVSVVDAANPVVFLRAQDLGFDGSELPAEIEARGDAMAVLEEVRGIVAEQLSIVADRSVATATSPGIPKVGFVSVPRSYVATSGALIDAQAIDVTGRLMSMQTAHRSYMGTGAVCTAAAAAVAGTVVADVARPPDERPTEGTLRIAHPYGVMEVSVRSGRSDSGVEVHSATVGRTARHIMDGVIWVPDSCFHPPAGAVDA